MSKITHLHAYTKIVLKEAVMKVVAVVAISALIVLAFIGGSMLTYFTKPVYPKTMRVQNSIPFVVHAGEWTPCPDTNFIAPGDGVSYDAGYIFIDGKFTGALVTVNIVADNPVTLRFVGYREGFAEFVGEMGTIDKVGSSLWQVEQIWEYYAIELYADVDTNVKLCRLGVQANR